MPYEREKDRGKKLAAALLLLLHLFPPTVYNNVFSTISKIQDLSGAYQEKDSVFELLRLHSLCRL